MFSQLQTCCLRRVVSSGTRHPYSIFVSYAAGDTTFAGRWLLQFPISHWLFPEDWEPPMLPLESGFVVFARYVIIWGERLQNSAGWLKIHPGQYNTSINIYISQNAST